MELNQVEAFLAVAQMKSFTQATYVLHLSQPAVSRRISLLEQELDVTLFERVHEGVVLTEAGHTFLPHAQKMLACVQDGIEAIHDMQMKAQGTVKLAMIGTLASTNFTTRLQQFREQYPDVQLQLRTARSSEVSDFVRSGAVHLGLRYFEDPDSELVSQLVTEELLVVVGSSSHDWGEKLTVDDLKDTSWVTFPIGQGSSGEPFARLQAKHLEQHGLDQTESIVVDSLTAQKRLIEADFGIGLLPYSSIQEELRLGTLQILSLEALQTGVPIMILYRKTGYLSKATRSLIDELLRND